MPVNFSYPITFLPCKSLEKTRNFYAEILKLPVVLEQAKCLIFRIGKSDNAAFWGFCSHYTEFLTNPEKVCLTLVVDSERYVDEWNSYLTDKNIHCTKEPKYNPTFKIYNAFYRDPMGYTVEIQSFDEGAQPINIQK